MLDTYALAKLVDEVIIMRAGDFHNMVGQRRYVTRPNREWECFKSANSHLHRSRDASLTAGLTFCTSGYTSGGQQPIYHTPVYELGVIDKSTNRAIRWLHPDFKEDFIKECESKGIDWTNAIDDLSFVTIDDYDEARSKVRELISEFYKSHPGYDIYD
jgi:hypothetical protein